MPFDTPSSTTLLCAGALGLFLLYQASEHVLTYIGIAPHRVKLPGPRGVPFFGNLIQLKDGHARPLGRWAKQYGPIIRVAFGDREAVIINSYGAVSQTLVQQGQAFQSRPKFKLWHGAFIKALEEDAPSTLGTSPMDDRVNMFRRHLTAQTAHVRARRYNHFISHRFYRFVNLLAETAKSGKAEDLGFHMWTTAIGLSTDMLFGIKLDEAYTRRISETELLIFRQRTIGKPLHDYVPAVALAEKIMSISSLRPLWKLLNLEEWVDDFNNAEETARQLRDTEAGYCKHLAQELHERIERGDLTPSQLGDLVRVYGSQITPTDEFRAATSLVGSGMGMGTLLAWLAPKLAASPQMQDKAYAAIKEIYGGDAPDPLDTDRVEYIKALAHETGRFFVTARLGFSRETSEEADIDGVKIPPGTLVMNNAFWINRDTDRYDSPDEFIPERWMDGRYGRMDGKPVKMGVPHLNHGAGRRFCIGIPYVAKVLYAAIVLMVHHFKFERGVLDEEAKEKVFLSIRKAKEMTMEVDPIADQVSERDPQAIPLMAGIKVTPRDPAGLARWLAEAPNTLDQFDQPDLSIKAAGEE